MRPEMRGIAPAGGALRRSRCVALVRAARARPALFDDEEARKRIAATNTRVDQLQKDLDDAARRSSSGS